MSNNTDNNLEHYNKTYKNLKSIVSKKEVEKIKKVIKKIIRSIPNKANFKIKSVLDIGCGLGHYSNAFSQLGFSVTGIDFSEIAIKRANEIYSNVEFIMMDGFKPQFNKTFDLIFCKGFSGANTHDINFAVDWTNKYINLLNSGGYFIFSYSTNLTGIETTNTTANWTKDEIDKYIAGINARKIEYYFFHYFGIFSLVYKKLNSFLLNKRRKEFYYIIFKKD